MSRIFLVDDHLLVREGLGRLLEAAGHSIAGEAGDVHTAAQIVGTSGANILLLDVNLEASSGLLLLEELKRLESTIATVILTMSSEPRHLAEALRLGALGYVLKGSPSQELLCAIEAAARGERFLGSRVAELALASSTLSDVESPLVKLSRREFQILGLVVRGHTSAAIGTALHLSPKTIDTYRSRVMCKLNLPDLPALVRFAVKNELIDAGYTAQSTPHRS